MHGVVVQTGHEQVLVGGNAPDLRPDVDPQGLSAADLVPDADGLVAGPAAGDDLVAVEDDARDAARVALEGVQDGGRDQVNQEEAACVRPHGGQLALHGHRKGRLVVGHWKTHLAWGRETFLAQCCRSEAEIEGLQRGPSGAVVLHFETGGLEGVVAGRQGPKPVYKNLYMQSKGFRHEIIEHYKAMGFGWVDVVLLNRTLWTLFLWPKRSSQ
ncbi:Hypothetical Protein FCC1311_112382 [Hondaea fermentalgiana]|uniref:Uncharacterized protein n=1 Tax=Hondaea fermentalgiana TaxID=2315210 RepID=A0A2R5GWQ9_9STRA|nr:Hypothetical Protein FCC1311_112382 [Hondaea fermentalgiana]|eukprot:GBG35015.1 Hypothetical Protein FCC1311_112382 [Hondaea fermentalgiana]